MPSSVPYVCLPMNPPSWPCADGVPPSHAVVMPDESAISIGWLNGFAWSTSSPRRGRRTPSAERAARAHGDEAGRDVLVARVEDARVARDLHVASDLDDLVVLDEHRPLPDDGSRDRVDRAVHDREERALGGLRLGPAVRTRVGPGRAVGTGTRTADGAARRGGRTRGPDSASPPREHLGPRVGPRVRAGSPDPGRGRRGERGDERDGRTRSEPLHGVSFGS